MSDPEVSESDDTAQFLNVNLYDTRSTNTILKVTTETTTSHLLETIFNKTEICNEDQQYFKLVLVITGSNSSLRRSTRHCVKTLQPHDLVLNTLIELKKKQQSKHQIHAKSVRWYFKDVRSLPLELGEACDLTGDDSSEDDAEISLNDLSCIKQADVSGYLLRRSPKDPNVWQQRYCVLTDKLWCVHDRLLEPRASCINLDCSTKVHSSAVSLNCHGAIIIQSSLRLHSFIAPSSSEQTKWMDEINLRAALTADNDVIGMAEVIICDEASTRSKRMQTGITPYLQCAKVLQSLTWCGGTRDLKVPAPNYQDKLRTSDNGTTTCHHPDLEHTRDVLKKIVQDSSNSSKNSILGARKHQKYSRTYLRELRREYSSIYEVLCFINSVCAYKELFRHDLGISSGMLWAAAITVINDCLVKLFEIVGVSMRSADERLASSENAGINPSNDSMTVIHDPVRTTTSSNFTSNGLQFPSIWDKISPKIALQLHHTVFLNIVRCARKSATDSELLKGPANGRSRKAFSKTPSAGGEDGGLRMFFGEGSASNLTPSLSAGGSSLWNWTSRALGLGDHVTVDEDCDEAAVSFDCADDLGRGLRYEKDRTASKSGGPSCQTSQCDFAEGMHVSQNCEGTYIVVKSSPDTEGSPTEEVYLLSDKSILPDYAMFDDLCDDLLRVLKLSL